MPNDTNDPEGTLLEPLVRKSNEAVVIIDGQMSPQVKTEGGQSLSERIRGHNPEIYNMVTGDDSKDLCLTADGAQKVLSWLDYPHLIDAGFKAKFSGTSLQNRISQGLAVGIAATSIAQIAGTVIHSATEDNHNDELTAQHNLATVFGGAILGGVIFSRLLGSLEKNVSLGAIYSSINDKEKLLREDLNNLKYSPLVQDFIKGVHEYVAVNKHMYATPAEYTLTGAATSGAIGIGLGASFTGSLGYGTIAGILAGFLGGNSKAMAEVVALNNTFKDNFTAKVSNVEQVSDVDSASPSSSVTPAGMSGKKGVLPTAHLF